MELLPHHRVFTSTDLDESTEFAGRIWERNRTALIDGDYGLRWNQLIVDKAEFSYIEHDCTVDLKTEGPLSDRFRLFIHDSGAIEHSFKGRRFSSHAGNVVVNSPGIDLGLKLEPCKFLLVTLDGGIVRDAMTQRFRRILDYSDWLDVLPHSEKAAALRSMTTWFARELDSPGSPLAAAGKPRLHAERLLLSLFVECLAETMPGLGETVERTSRAQVRMAESWIEAHLAEPIGVEEVASAIGVGIRSLQMSFRQVLGCSPHEFIMRRRLEAARKMLLDAGDQATVTAVAMSLGFFELGRFSQRYRQHFGEMPSATLTRSARRQ